MEKEKPQFTPLGRLREKIKELEKPTTTLPINFDSQLWVNDRRLIDAEEMKEILEIIEEAINKD